MKAATDLLIIAEAQIAEKQVQEINKIKERLEKDKEILKEAIDLVNSHTLYKKVNESPCSSRYRYVLATEEMLKSDYLNGSGGIRFHYDYWKERYNRGILEVDGETYYDIRYALNTYERELEDKRCRINRMMSTMKDLEKDLEDLKSSFPELKRIITEWMEYREDEGANE